MHAEGFKDIVDDKPINGVNHYKFTFDSKDKNTWISESSELGIKSIHLINEYLKRKNFLNSKITSEDKKCCVDKSMMCLNKTKTRGKPSNILN